MSSPGEPVRSRDRDGHGARRCAAAAAARPDLEGAGDAGAARAVGLSRAFVPFNPRDGRVSPSNDGESTSPAETKRSLVLVVDDDDELRTTLRELLDDAGFVTVAARDGLEALEILADLPAPPAFILLDLRMPVMDGWAFCDVCGRNRTLRQIPIVAISADEITDASRPAGVDAFVAKPLDLEKIARLALRISNRNEARAWAAERLQ